MSIGDTLAFLRAWIANPLAVGAIAPSGTALAELMTREITSRTGPVIELGAGTGVFTRALIVRGVPETDLTLIDYGSDFARLLELRYPRARVLWMDAAQLAHYNLFDTPEVGAVVSGLPLLNMSPRQVAAILAGAFRYVRPRGAFYQFTYGPACPVPRTLLDRLGLKAACVGRALLNVPPAAVYRITRRRRNRLLIA